MGKYKYGRTWKEVDVGTHTLSCVCVLTLGKVSQTKNGREFLFDSTGNPRRVCPGMRTALEADRNRENGRKRRKKGTKKSGA
jgi:hypothetical protein